MDSLMIFAAKYLMLLPVIVLGIYFLRRPRQDKKQMVIFAVLALVITYAIALIIGHFVIDPRPFVVEHFTPLIAHDPDNGFPSDHALLVSALAMIGLYWNRKLGAALWIIGIIVSVARVYVGVHHTVDIVGSMAIAIIGAYIAYMISRRIDKSPQASGTIGS